MGGREREKQMGCETKTKDNVFVTLVASVQYRAHIDAAEDAFYKLSKPHEQFKAYVFDVVRASVPRMLLDDVFEQKNEIAKNVAEELEKVMHTYGYEIVQTLIVDIEPDEIVKRAMNEINAAARMRAATNEKAEGQKILQVKQAEGEAEASNSEAAIRRFTGSSNHQNVQAWRLLKVSGLQGGVQHRNRSTTLLLGISRDQGPF
ncbi:unnamed protein product [Sphagnum balticum]